MAHSIANTALKCQAVFDTVELLERILLQLDLQQIFTCLRVSSLFRNTIANSILLQQRMLLAPSTEYEKAAPENARDPGQAIWCFDDHRSSGNGGWRTRCPLLVLRDDDSVPAQKPYLYGLDLPPNTKEGQSWTRIFLCNPPVIEVYADIVYYNSTTIYEYIGKISNSGGVTLGDMVPSKRKFGKKGDAEALGAYGGAVRSAAGEVKIPESVKEKLKMGDSSQVAVDLQRSRFAFYRNNMVKLNLQLQSA